ncbi:MAG: hypothetical protein WCO00_14670 [Rhodospirillaceae bacterium]
MIMSPITPADLDRILTGFAARLSGQPRAAAAFARIAATWPVASGSVDTPAQRADAVRLAHRFGIGTLDEEPQRAFSWDGRVIRWRTEASVTVHEVAHWQLCAPERRGLPDFGLGAGPESGLKEIADAALAVGPEQREHEEVLTSLLGILWEAELGHPAILAFLEQNWLEGAERPSTVAFFVERLEELSARGLVDAGGRPCPPPQPLSQAA